MKKVLLGTTALLGVGTIAGGAMASDGIKLEVGGFFRTAYQVNIDDNGEGEAGNERNVDGVFQDAEVHFKGEVTLDNGLTAGARIELEGETAGDQIDESYIYFSGGFGEFRAGSDDDALATMCVTPPSSTTNFGVFSPNQWAANTAGFLLSSNTVCSGVDESSGGDAEKIAYYTPNFSGFQLGISYTPVSAQSQGDVGPHVGMVQHTDGQSRHNVAAYANYSYEGDGWGLTWGGGGSWEGRVENSEGKDRPNQDFYQTGLNLSFGSFKVGGAFEYFHDLGLQADDSDADAWVAGGGVSYNVDAWTVGLGYSHGSLEASDSDDNSGHDKMDRVALTGNYDMGPGISLDAELAYTWTSAVDNSNPNDNYDALEIGIGTAFTF